MRRGEERDLSVDLPYVFCWRPGYDGGVGWYRTELPLREYARRGGRCSHSGIITAEAYSLADVIVGGLRGGQASSKLWLEMCERADKLMVYDIDDDLFNVPAQFPADFQRTPERLAEMELIIRAAHVVTVSTPFLAERLCSLNANIHVVPNRVPRWLTDWDRPRSGLTVGWAGSKTHAMDWADAAPRIGRFLARNPGVQFHAMGYPGVIDFTGWPIAQVRTSGWCDDAEEYYRSIDFDIGAIPLRPNLFNKSKSAIKSLEYAALGIPAVASAYGPYETFVKHGETGYLIRRDHEWERCLRDLAADPEVRAHMGQNARRQAKCHTVEGNLDSWLVPWGVGVTPVQPRSDEDVRQLEGLSVLRHLGAAADGMAWVGTMSEDWLRMLVPPKQGDAPSAWLTGFVARARRSTLSAEDVERLVAEARSAGEAELANWLRSRSNPEHHPHAASVPPHRRVLNIDTQAIIRGL